MGITRYYKFHIGDTSFKKNFVIDRPDYIKTLTPQEWMNVKCEISDRHQLGEFVIGANDSEYIPEAQKPHLNCISLRAADKIARDKSVRG